MDINQATAIAHSKKMPQIRSEAAVCTASKYVRGRLPKGPLQSRRLFAHNLIGDRSAKYRLHGGADHIAAQSSPHRLVDILR